MKSHLKLALIAVLTAVAFTLVPRVQAQATETATRDYSFAAFATGSETSTGVGPRNAGATVGFDVTRHLHLFDPSFEVRVGIAPGPTISERSVLVGFKVEKRIGRFHPYGDFLIGTGTIAHTRSGFTDNSTVPSFGGGVDFDLSKKWALKADYIRQSWKVGKETTGFSPSTLSIGIVYGFHF